MKLTRWLPTFLAFPLGALLAVETVGAADDPLSAAAAGLVAGAVVGGAQWLALRRDGVGARWAAATAAAIAAGSALAAALTGGGTELADVLLAGAVTGAAVGAAQSGLLHRGARIAAGWTALSAAGWTLAWLATWLTIVDIERGYVLFGSSGAIVLTLLTGLALRRILGPAPAPAAVAA